MVDLVLTYIIVIMFSIIICVIYCDFRCQAYPHVPTFPGHEKFRGSIVHSSEYRIPEVYKDSRVLLVGAGPTAWDLVLDVAPEAKSVSNL